MLDIYTHRKGFILKYQPGSVAEIMAPKYKQSLNLNPRPGISCKNAYMIPLKIWINSKFETIFFYFIKNVFKNKLILELSKLVLCVYVLDIHRKERNLILLNKQFLFIYQCKLWIRCFFSLEIDLPECHCQENFF